MTIQPGTLVHYHHSAFQLDRDFDYTTHSRQRHDKPRGLWVTVEGEHDWPTWCRAEEYGIDGLAVAHIVELDSWANILRIATAQELDAFTAEYGVPWRSMHDFIHEIDWAAVAQHFHGILITPYLHERRYTSGSSWYYTWDVASGCIWNLDAIASFRAVEVTADA